ncbi:MAG: N-acetyl-gamma-glutamyl-phosphate reductase [Nitrososphaerota archaeon]|nr:N-acetyl-gamma-glutamyl-phosphate reductase [Nitrososphaerota archaeon]MDG6941488.1 N-acetyl-gamma-glutamyl-phosphate reductase [Nitrososphaerota archaeon]MDG6951029.1 N-acetyl-gamma-glutamyl-phosphate reductase [Nitrososphaerota archaeon]
MVRVGVLAGSGYIGGELLRLLLQHPEAEVAYATSRRYAGEYVFRVHPNLRGVTDLKFVSFDPSKLVASADVVFAALPHGESAKVIPQLADAGLRIVDLSADFRLGDSAQYPVWYGYEHPRPDLLEKFVLSIPELNREEVKGARLVASPGCTAITTILALAPLLRTKSLGVDTEHIVVDAKVGSSGSGGKPSLATHFSERFNVVRPYKPAGHRHAAEIEQVLSAIAGVRIKVSMSAHGVNIVRGILTTSHLFASGRVNTIDIWKAYREAYSGCRFVRIVKDKHGPFRLPDPKLVIGSNFCDVGFETEERTGRIVALGATDNLIKGAAGNAVQSMNLMLGLDEASGLAMASLHPV